MKMIKTSTLRLDIISEVGIKRININSEVGYTKREVNYEVGRKKLLASTLRLGIEEMYTNSEVGMKGRHQL